MNNHRFKVPNTNLTFEAGPRTLRIVGGHEIDVNDTNIRYALQEMLRLAERAKELEAALAAAGEAREDAEIRLSGRIAELTEETRDLRAVLKTIFALNPEMAESDVARFQARADALRDRVREEMEKNASLRADLVSLRIDLSVAVKDGRLLEAERGVLRDRVTTLEQEAAHLEEENAKLKGEITGLEQENEGNAGYLRQCEILEAENAKLLDDLRAVTTEIHGSLTVENIRLEEELHASKAYAAVMAEEDRKLAMEVDRLRLSDARLTGLRLEVEILKLENRRIREAEQRAVAHGANVVNENVGLRTDLREAIKTGEEQAGKIRELEDTIKLGSGGLALWTRERATVSTVANDVAATLGFTDRLSPVAAVTRLAENAVEQRERLAAIQKRANEALTERGGPRWSLGAETGIEALIETIAKLDHDITALEDCRREWLAWGNDAQKRLSRLDALLSSEQVPEGLIREIYETDRPTGPEHPENLHAAIAWRWFRGQLGEPASE